MSRARWTDADPTLEGLLAKAKQIEEPPAAAVARVASLVNDTLLHGTAAAHAAKAGASAVKGAAATAGAAKATGAVALGAKGLAALAIVVAIGGTVVAVHATRSPRGGPSVYVAPIGQVGPSAAAPLRVAKNAEEAVGATTAQVMPLPSVPPPSPVAQSAVAAQPSAPRPAPRVDDPPRRRELAEERALLDPARAALARGDAVAALAATRVHEERFGDGTLVEEREAIGIQALVLEGRLGEARARAARFAAAHPDSLVLPAILASVSTEAAHDD